MIKKTVRPVIMFVALLPVFVFVALISVWVFEKKNYYFLKIDYLIFSLSFLYTLILFFLRKYKEWILRLILVTYSLSFVVLGTELIFKLREPYLPSYPMHRVCYVKDNVMPGISGKVEFSINRYGLRGPNTDLKKTDLKILIIGGSAAECLYVTDKLSWPWLLQDKLTEKTGKKIFVGNAGKSGQFSLHHIYMLQEYKYAPQFDWVILLAGINDAGRFLNNDYEKRKSRVEATTFINKGGNRIFFNDSKLFHRLGYIFYSKTVLPHEILQDNDGSWHEFVRERRQRALKVNTINQEPSGINEALSIYKNNLRKFINICRQRNQKVIILTQPTLWHKGLPADFEKLLFEYKDENSAYSTEVLEKVMKAYNQAALDVCQQEGILCIDLAARLSSDYSMFYDDCHLNINGCEKMANILSGELLKVINLSKK